MIPRKGLYAMHFSNFVKELKFRSLDYLVDGSTSNQTIFVESEQRDDIPEEDTADFRVSSFSSKQGLMYQFADEAIDLATFLDSRKVVHKLLDSRLCSKKRVGGCFKLKLSASNSNSKVRVTVNDEIEILSPAVNVGNNSLVYVTDKDVDPPSNFKNSLGELISSGSIPRHLDHLDIDKKSCLSTLGYLNQFDLFSLSDNSKGYSVFLPCAPANSASIADQDLTYYASNESRGNWKNLGLILNYLEANPKVFQGILKGFFIEDTIYSDFGLEGGKKKLSTDNLRGDPVKVQSDLVSAGNHYINLNKTKLTLPINSDILFNQGVIHLVDQVLLPENFSVSLPDLLKTTIDPNYPKYSLIDLLDHFPKLKKTLGLVAVDGTFSHEFSLLVPTQNH
ncbi:hypothetical protein G9P44_006153 [Scheffersomyces stipitis]|nr:hypothetical protein G9P44_006153 [Scheffersomyces stipitis]